MNHPTTQQLQEYADGVRPEQLELHLHACPSCRGRVEFIGNLERSLRSLPRESVPPEFTQRVMKQIGIRESATFGWSVVRNLAPFVALTIVLGILVAVMKLSGSPVPESVGQTQSIASTAAAKMSSALGTATQWAKTFLPFAFAEQSSGITVFALLFLGVVGMLDRFVIAPIFRKRA
jgi:predicted anti-sigma-YlaC factor YlaD